MTQELRNELEKMSEIDFRELEQAMNIAAFARNMQKKHEVTTEWICKQLEIEESQWPSIINASYPFDLRMLSKIQATNDEIAAIRAKENAEQLVKFPPYGYSEKPK